MKPQEFPSTRPYLIRALYEWCTDNGFTPYLVVRVNESVQVPREYVNNGEIVLNASYDATSGLQLGNDFIEFKARFGGRPHDIMVPVRRVVAIYARENGQGMAFPLEEEVFVPPAAAVVSSADSGAGPGVPGSTVSERGPVQLQSVDGSVSDAHEEAPRPPPPTGGAGRPSLKRIK
ncbi:MAG: ClpXP protease specificity-enhancing factor [Diaphorobacter nitroreducens]|uniref:ClpXP protease specificity-enhancing factor n=1 Tax=Diaphorobacter nitroreducens TaxID=164759 RepID=UPI000B59CB16|nr:ClpXP protease specificity-enhancing factor [Diaphorobacter nitroreducens]ASI69007.1 ClpXP protease specificity-enhancing factor [Diaphorobacter nitroreducens]